MIRFSARMLVAGLALWMSACGGGGGSSAPATISVPNLVGQTQVAATTAITGASLVVGSLAMESSDTVPSGTVISQSPAGGTAVASGSAVNLTVSSGPAGATVPNVVGLTQAAATTAITGAELIVGTVTMQSSSTVAAGSVISQSPAGGTAVTSGSTVNLIVSSGPAGATVPNVIGKTQAAATTAITGAHLVIGTVSMQSSGTVAAGSVISQSPAGGTAVASGSAVNLVVSSGPATAAVETVLYSFGASNTDGQGPQAGLIQGADGNLYGTCSTGGVWDEGTVFNVTPAGVETQLYSFAGGPNDSANPVAVLILGADGNFYGTTVFGGANGGGTDDGSIFKITPAGAETPLYSFGASATDGINPLAGLILGTDGNFYGTTENGGAHCSAAGTACGSVFKITPAGAEIILYSFGATNTDGNTPQAGLIQGTDGNFYGTTTLGGAHGGGTVFKITPAGVETVLYSFGATSADAFEPRAGLILGTDGNFYGTTYAGGANQQSGTVFKITPAGAETVLYSFGATSTDGSGPVTGLLQGADGNFYGTTSTGGANGGGATNSGTVFKLTPAGMETVLHSFGTTSTDGAEPEGALIQDKDGNLYGTTFFGGANNEGTVFKITL